MKEKETTAITKVISNIKEMPLKQRIWYTTILLYFGFAAIAFIFELFYLIVTGSNLEHLLLYQWLKTWHTLIILITLVVTVGLFIASHYRFQMMIKSVNKDQDERRKDFQKSVDEGFKYREEAIATLKTADQTLAEAKDILAKAELLNKN